MRFYDTHAHLDDEQFADDIDGVLSRAKEQGVDRVLAMGTTAESSRKCVELARLHAELRAAVGIQPNYVAQADPLDWPAIESLAALPEVVAIGETGLDRYWDYSPWPLQVDYFRRHMQLAHDMRLPFVVHMRDCDAELLEELQLAHQRLGTLRGVMHSFTGTAEMARHCIELGLHISFAGMITYKKSQELRAVATTVPLDRLLIETDSPYLSPEPSRGVRPNEPRLVVHTAACIATARQEELSKVAEATYENGLRLFQRL